MSPRVHSRNNFPQLLVLKGEIYNFRMSLNLLVPQPAPNEG